GESSGIAGGAWAFTFQTWQKEQGLPLNPIRALAQTHEGYLWLGSDEGLARFDGLRFVPIGIHEGLKIGAVRALMEDSRGALWIGSLESGLTRWQNRQAITLTMREGLPADTITALAEDGRGRLWVGTDAGLVFCENGRVLPAKAAEVFQGHRINALFKDRRGGMWVAVKNLGVFQFANDQFVRVKAETLDEVLKEAHCLLVDQAERLWIGAGEDFVLCHEGERWHRYRIPRNQAKSYVSTLAEEPDGTVWAGSAGGGLLRFREGKSGAVPAGSGLAGSQVESLLTDREGRLWVGTEAGLNGLRRKSLVALSQAEGLGYGPAQGLAEVSPGIVWVGKPNSGLYRWDGKSFSRLSVAGLSPHDSQVSALLVTRDGFCWVATTNGLLLYKDPIAAADEVKVIRPAKPNIISLAEDREGALWIGTREGKLWELREDKWMAQTNFFETNAITSLVPGADGSMWVGTDGNGLYRKINGGFHHLGKSEGLAGKVIRTLYLDPQGTLWIGTGDAGLSRWVNGRVATFSTREGLPDDTVSQILEDDAGRLWLGTSSGIACVNKNRLDELAAGKITAVYPQLFRRTEGMLSEECTGGFSPAGLKTRSGLLWFSTVKGVAVVNPRVQPATVIRPTTLLEEIVVDGVPTSGLDRPAAGSATLRITPGKHRVEFRYTGLSFDAPEAMRFRYRLEGLDTEWVEAGTRRAAFYSYLPPGDYRFRVAACNRDGFWSDSETGLRLSVLRHFWQTWWFNAGAGLGFVASVVAAVHLMEKRKLQRRLKRLEQESALERERTRIARDLHDEMGAKLCRISFLSEHARRGALPPDELRNQITSISDASREVLHSLDEIVWAVNPQNDTLEHVASYIGQYAQEYFQMTGIECELDIATPLPPHPLSSQMRHHLFLAAHEALTNILKHSGATRAGISMVSGQDAFEINIFDNGEGFISPANGAGPETAASASGDGLSNMRKRLADVGGQCQVDSTVGKGTTVRFVIPLNSFRHDT
ncbi:MAG TPA: two-component regulator propeller domain-containing protein, partial [Methylomirabilota bacterium]|nr:two-component regulator propeller domain-containing protein [Methylomirabilota bacterium]